MVCPRSKPIRDNAGIFVVGRGSTSIMKIQHFHQSAVELNNCAQELKVNTVQKPREDFLNTDV